MSVEQERLDRLRSTMRRLGVPAVLTADPINIGYATGLRNMTIYSMMGPSRFALIVADGPIVVWEHPGSEHLALELPLIDDVRTAEAITPAGGPRHEQAIDRLAAEVVELVAPFVDASSTLGVERFDHPVTDALRRHGSALSSATEVFVEARLIKTAAEIATMWESMRHVLDAMERMRQAMVPGRTEVEVWSEFHRHLVATGGEYVSTRLAHAGPRTFPYFNEAGTNIVESGDLFSVDTDAIGIGGYAADFSRTYLCGDDTSEAHRHDDLWKLAKEQVDHNAAQLGPTSTFEDFARAAWRVPQRFVAYSYSCLAHGLGLSGEFPYVPTAMPPARYPLPGEFRPGMVICIESYIGDPDTRRGVKLEDQYLITDTGAKLMSTAPP